jgi:cell division protein FtsZ
MKSLIEEALSRDDIDGQMARSMAPAPDISGEDKAVDTELEQMLRSLKTNIKIIGCGGGGCNTISRIAETDIHDAELMAANTDAQHLLAVNAPKKILLGKRCTRGLGAGAVPQVGEEAALEAEDEIRDRLQGTDIVFLTCGLGGGTGTGSISVISRIARELDCLSIAFVTTPFKGEGDLRMQNAKYGLNKLKRNSDTVVVIPNDKLIEIAPNIPLNMAFKMADEVLMRSIKGLVDIVTRPGLVNLDFNDLKTVMKGGGTAMIGMGESDSVRGDRAKEAIEEALNSPFLDVDISEATGVIVNVVGGSDMTINEAEKVAEIVQDRVSSNARIIWGAAVDPTLEKTVKVMIVLTGVKSPQMFGNSGFGQRDDVYMDFVQ